MSKFLTILMVALLTVVHGLIVLGSTFSLPLILMYPNIQVFYLAGIAVLLVTWALFSDCPLTVAEQKLRARIHWPQLKGDFIRHYIARLTGFHFSLKAHQIVERVYFAIVVAVILIRWRLA